MPLGWAQFPLRGGGGQGDERAAWHRAYHATRPGHVRPLLQVRRHTWLPCLQLSVQAGQLLAPAELGLTRTVAVSQRGHSKEDGADASPVHFSPSLSRAASATPASLWEAASVQVALLVAVQPGSYKVIYSS